jgi:hypothetical protein
MENIQYKKYKEIEEMLPNLLGSIPNVTGWGFGRKEVADSPTDIACITVYVQTKHNVPYNQSVPKEINGLPTDVVQIKELVPNTISAGYKFCKACYTGNSLATGNITYGLNNPTACVPTINCSGEYQDPSIYPNLGAEVQGQQSCNCVDNRGFIYSSTGSNTGHPVITGGKSAITANNFTGTCGTPGSQCSSCSLGIVAKDMIDGNLVVITNHHCFGYSSTTPYLTQADLLPTAPIKVANSTIYKNELNAFNASRANWASPSSLDTLGVPGLFANSPDVIGEFKRAIFVEEGIMNLNNKVDAQVVSLKLPNQHNNYVIPLPGIIGLGDGPFPWITKQEFQDWFMSTMTINLKLYKSGRSGGVSTDNENILISAIDASIVFSGSNHRFNGVITGSSTNNRITSGPGDSGSPVLINKDGQLYVLGLHFAGGTFGTTTNYTYNGQTFTAANRASYSIIPIWEIKEKLQVEAWDGKVVVNSSDVNITINGLPYTRQTITSKPITHKKD